MARLAFRGLLVNLSLIFVLFVGIIVFSALFGVTAAIGGFRGMPFWVFGLWGAIAICAVQFQTGRWLARRARGKEMAACVAFLIVDMIVMQIVGEAVFGGPWGRRLANNSAGVPGPEITGASVLIENLVCIIVLFAGAVRLRSGQDVLK